MESRPLPPTSACPDAHEASPPDSAAALFARQLEVLQAASARLSRAEGSEAVGRAIVEGTGRIIDDHNARVYIVEPSGDLVPIAVPIGVSVGAATVPTDGRIAAEIIAVADAGLYRMKRARRVEEPKMT